MSLVLATEKEIVRDDMCGEPDTTELKDATLERFFTVHALAWLNTRRPGKKIALFQTVANQQDYDVKPAAAYHITNVWWMAASWLTFSPTMRVIPGAMDIDDQLVGIDVMSNPALVTDFFKKIAYYEDAFKGHGAETAEGKIRLIPMPNAGGEAVGYEYTYARWSAITAVANEYVEGVRNHAAMLGMRHLATKRGIITGGSDWSGGGGSMEKTMHDMYMGKAEALVPEMPLFATA